jgi:hypothetical protein
MDDSDPYPALFRIDWSFYNNAVLNLKKRLMSFETNILCMVSSLDLYEVERYNEPVDEDSWRSTIENISPQTITHFTKTSHSLVKPFKTILTNSESYMGSQIEANSSLTLDTSVR